MPGCRSGAVGLPRRSTVLGRRALGQSRETARRSELAGYAAYGWSRSHSRNYWGFRLVLVCAPDGMPIGFELAAANVSERNVAAEILERLPPHGRTILADKGFAGRDFEAFVEDLGGRLLALAAAIRHNQLAGTWDRSLIAYDH